MEALSPVIAANLHCLEQAIELLGRLPEKAFARTEERHAQTVGPHLRHMLDHYSAFIAGLPGFRANYDARLREPRLESDLEFAAARLRELQFLLSHTVHHFALIATLLERFEIGVPEDFGIAPSTLKYWQAQAQCAPLPG